MQNGAAGLFYVLMENTVTSRHECFYAYMCAGLNTQSVVALVGEKTPRRVAGCKLGSWQTACFSRQQCQG